MVNNQLLRVLSIGAFLCLMGLSLFSIRHPFVTIENIFQSTLVIAAVGLVLGRGAIWSKPSRAFIPLLVLALISVPFVALSQAFGSVGVISLIFHAHFGVEDAGLAGFGPEIAGGVLLVTYVAFAAYALANLTGWHKTTYFSATLALFAVSPMLLFAIRYGTLEEIDSDLHARIVTPVLVEPAQKPDIIIVYLEGIERAFDLTAQFGDVFDPLHNYENKGVSFTQVRQVHGTGWSLAGLVSTQCGVPLASRGLRNIYDFDQESDFLEPIHCLSDGLTEMGYQTKLVVGGSQDFGGFRHFFETHNIDNVYDRPRIRTLYTEAEYDAAWMAHVVDDQMIFDTAIQLYDQGVATDDPMMMIIETYGPHGAASVLSRSCTQTGRAEMAPDPASAVSCTLRDTDRFLAHVADNRKDRPTVVVLASDHLNHDPVIKASFRLSERANTVIFFGLGMDSTVVQPGTVIDRPATMMDVYPSLLSFAGFGDANAQAGLGRSLFGEAPTLIEEKGFARFDAEIFPNPRLSRVIWGDLD